MTIQQEVLELAKHLETRYVQIEGAYSDHIHVFALKEIADDLRAILQREKDGCGCNVCVCPSCSFMEYGG